MAAKTNAAVTCNDICCNIIIRNLNLSKKAKKKYKKIAHAREYREAHPKKKLNAYA